MSELRGWPAVRTIARREIRERGRDRSTLISTIVTLVILAGVLVVPTLVGAGDDPKVKVVVVGDDALTLARSAQIAERAFDVRIHPQRAASDEAATRTVADGDADVAIVDDGARLVLADDVEDGGVAAIQTASQRLRASAALARAGVGPDRADDILSPPPLPTREVGDGDPTGLAFIVLLVLYGQLLTYGIVVATGIVEEKQSRIVELVLSAIRPRDLLAGKVLGIGVVAFAQLLAIGATGVALAAATGSLDVGGAGVPGALGITLAWFVLGYALFACAYAAGGALVSRQEELNSATTPITMVVLGAFLVSFGALSDPGSSLAQVLSYVPPCTPLVLPIRQITGHAGALDVLGGVAVMLVAIAVLITLAGRIYGNAVLRTGARVSLRAALRA